MGIYTSLAANLLFPLHEKLKKHTTVAVSVNWSAASGSGRRKSSPCNWRGCKNSSASVRHMYRIIAICFARSISIREKSVPSVTWHVCRC